MSGAKIIEALEEAANGDLARVWIDGVCWSPERRWQDISTAPKDGTRILVFQAEDVFRATPQIAVWQGQWVTAWDHTPLDGETWARPSHWHPLPEPPEASQ